MKAIKATTLKPILICLIALALITKAGANTACPVIPLPAYYTKTTGTLALKEIKFLIVERPELMPIAGFLRKAIKDGTGYDWQVQSGALNRRNAIILTLKEKGKSPGYSLSVSESNVEIKGTNAESVFNAVNSLLQLARLSSNGNIDCWHIEDRPGFEWRGLMLDESRHFFGKTIVKQLLDWMAFYKLNRFHWHLTDRQGWRIEIKKYPRLALVGGIGNHTDSTAKAAYYTQEDIKEIVSYANERFITIIPEIDMPGHATAANRAYPHYSADKPGISPGFTFNPGLEDTYSYLTQILKEVRSIFPTDMIHIGGDEVHFGNKNWMANSHIRQLMSKEKLSNVKEVEAYFIRRMADSIRRMNTRVLGWDEIAEVDGLPKSTVIFWWRYNQENLFKETLNKGYQAVLCPQVPFYFDFIQDSTHVLGRKRARDKAFNSIKRIYNFSLKEFSDAINDNNKHLILGIQANVWTERIRSNERLQYQIFPRIASLAEVSWCNSSPKQKDYKEFEKRIAKHLKLYEMDAMKFYNPLRPDTTPEIIDLNAD